MIIHSAKEQPFCIRVEYSHETDVFKNTKETQKFMSEFKNTFRIKKSQSMAKMTKRDDNYNKYYINPEQRYIKKSTDPKKELPTLQNEQFLYRNLHNQQFNSWRHPFEADQRSNQASIPHLSEQSIKKLLKFKSHMETVKKGRLPMLVNQFIPSHPN